MQYLDAKIDLPTPPHQVGTSTDHQLILVMFYHRLQYLDAKIDPPTPPHQVGTSTDRQLILIDRNRDLYIVGVMKRQPAKLASMVDSALWHNTTGMLAALVDQKLVGVWECVCMCALMVIHVASMLDSALWHNTTGMLAALVDQKPVCVRVCVCVH